MCNNLQVEWISPENGRRLGERKRLRLEGSESKLIDKLSLVGKKRGGNVGDQIFICLVL